MATSDVSFGCLAKLGWLRSMRATFSSASNSSTSVLDTVAIMV